jgi:Fe-S-cluster containining protein
LCTLKRARRNISEMSGDRTFCLTVHAPYACRHSGACCRADWPIPVEPDVRRAIEIRGIRSRSGRTGPVFAADPASSAGVVTARTADGQCVFFEPDHGRLCAIHRVAGAALLPSACRHFPRVALRDPRGTFVTLSHFCPAAASLLLEPADLAIIEAPASLCPAGALEGFDATAVMPPLLRPGLLTDLDGYATWERLGIATLNRGELRVEHALDVIAQATRGSCDWRPGATTLSEHVARAFARHNASPSAAGRPRAFDRPARAFLAAHLFANWIAYQGTGLADVVLYLQDALALLMREMAERGSLIEAVRATDLRLRHSHADLPRSGGRTSSLS